MQFWEIAAFLLAQRPAWPPQWVRTKITTFMSAEAGKEKNPQKPQITFLLPSKLYSYHPFTLSTGRWEDCFLILKYYPCGSLIVLFLFKQLNPYSNYGTKTLLKLETQPALLSSFSQWLLSLTGFFSNTHSHTAKSGCNYKELISSPLWDSPRPMQWALGSGKTTHGGNYGITLRQECSHDGHWDLMEVPPAG